MSATELAATAQALVAPGKGILAADESHPSIEKHFKSLGIDNTESNRRDYREMMFTTEGIAEWVSGVILFDETIRQKGADGTLLVDKLKKQKIIPGIKVDAGPKDLPFSPGEVVTEGLDGLRGRLKDYYDLGARFAKWRSVINIGSDGRPTDRCLQANAHALARYAALCQEASIVPIVEPEVIMDGDHDIARCYDATERALHTLFNALYDQKVTLEHLLLKPNMVISGKGCKSQADVATVAAETLKVFYRTVPAAVPGIVFLSGGQSAELATEHLNAMNQKPHPWAISFSYGRALQAPAMKAWGGKAAQIPAGRKAFAKRARLNSAARHGKYTPSMEKDA
jgi:fructose-bisphosphate aldolase class I